MTLQFHLAKQPGILDSFGSDADPNSVYREFRGMTTPLLFFAHEISKKLAEDDFLGFINA